MAKKSNRKLWADYLEKKASSPKAVSNSLGQSSLGESFSGVVLGIDPSLRGAGFAVIHYNCLLYTSPSPRDRSLSRMPSSA